MRIAMVSDSFYPHVDGVTTTILGWVKELAKKGHKILIIAPEYESNNKIFLHSNIRIKRIKSASYSAYPEFRVAKFKIFEFLSCMKKFNPDIIHSHCPGTLGWMAYIAKRALKKPFVVTYHTHIADFNKYFFIHKIFKIDKLIKNMKTNYEKKLNIPLNKKNKSKNRLRLLYNKNIVASLKKIDSLMDGIENKSTLNKKIIWGYSNMYHNLADVILTPSKAVKYELEKHNIKKPIIAVSNGIKTKGFIKKKDYRLKSKILHVGRLGYEKNIEIVIKAMKSVTKIFPDVKLSIIGGGPAYYKLYEMQKELGIENNISFLGSISYDKIKKIYKDYDLFVTASTIETLGMVILEAMSAGLPIVGANSLAIPELVRNNKNGALIRPFDDLAFSKAMIKILKNQRLRESMGKRSVEYAKEHEIENVIKKVENIYSDVLKNSE